MSQLLHLSRNFVEFGPFTSEEIQTFKSRAILNSLDFLRADGSDTWIPVDQWSFTATEEIAKKPTAKPTAKKAKAESTPKAAAKATKKSAKKIATQAPKE